MTIPNLFDLHCDTPSAIFNATDSAVSFGGEFERQAAVFAFYIPKSCPQPYSHYRAMLREFKSENNIPINSLTSEKTVFLSVEGGAPFEKDLERIYSLKRDQISSVSLCWNEDNLLAGGAFGFGGLTRRGIDAIKIINDCRMVLDISHQNEVCAIASCEYAENLLASHSNSYSVWPHKRNLSDTLLKILAERKALVGINFYPEFLGEGDVFDRIFAQTVYMLELGLEDSLAIGSDLDGAEMSEKLKNTGDISSLYDYLLCRLGDKKLVNKIFFDNAYRFYQKVFDKRV